jgi:triacylglycerol lipase
MKPLPGLDPSLLLPPVLPTDYAYFAEAAKHPFEANAAPSLCHAWWLAECALAAYADIDMARAIFAPSGMSIAGDCAVIGTLGGQAYVLHNETAIVVAFRGTQVIRPGDPASFAVKSRAVLRDYLTDAKTVRTAWQGRSGGSVHRGFAASLEELLPEVQRRVLALAPRRLWITGHSLGAGLATLAADRLEAVHALITFGSPQVGDADFAAAWRVPTLRFRNRCDIVPWLPGSALGYSHIEVGRYINQAGVIVGEPDTRTRLRLGFATFFTALGESWRTLLLGKLAGLTPECLHDHAPLCYAILTWNAYVREE